MLYIAEKPELARAIVEGLGGGTKRNGHYECGADRVTWCFGHMLELYEPEDYDPSYRKWTLEALPMFFVPWKKRPIPKSKEQFAVIVGLLREADVVCHAGDPDAEGQLLVDELLRYTGYVGPVKRVLIAYMGGEIARVLDNGLSLNIEKHPCPTCGGAMTPRKAGGKAFWGCSAYPSCKTTLPDDNGKPGARSQTPAADPSVVCPLCGKAMRLRNHPKGEFFGCAAYPRCKGSIKARDGKPATSEPRPSVSEKHKCRTCGKGLVRRSDKKDGSFFWGCSDYPQCKTSYPDLDGKPNYTAREKKQ